GQGVGDVERRRLRPRREVGVQPRGYRTQNPEAGPAETVGQMVTDHLLRRPLHRLAEARPGSSYLYEFAWPSNRPGLGACHALELGFVFDTGELPDAARLAGAGAPQDLADAMHGAWVRFATTGDPGWQPWDDTHPVRVLGDGEPRTVSGPRDAEFALWTPGTPPTHPERTAELALAVRRLRRSVAAVRRH
ncbi:carboxylesterase family protein, partial [Streptomyces sp. NPDC059627]